MDDDAITEGSEPLDCQLDDVAGLEPATDGLGRSPRMQPEPTLPEPSTSPGRRAVSRLAWARS